jgi:hypothetical protein
MIHESTGEKDKIKLVERKEEEEKASTSDDFYANFASFHNIFFQLFFYFKKYDLFFYLRLILAIYLVSSILINPELRELLWYTLLYYIQRKKDE